MPWQGGGSAGCSDNLCAKAHYSPLPTNDSGPAEQGADFTKTESRVASTVLELNAYHIASATLIMMNAMVLGAETDYPDWPGWNYIENAFLLCFTAEVLLRLSALGPGVFFFCSRNPEIIWDMFDVLVVSVGLLDLLITLLCPGRRSMKVAMLFRIVRLLRLLRILRIFRFLKQLYLMAYGFTEAVLAICWVTIFMSFVLYMCGIVLARVYGHVSPEDKDYLFLIDHFGTVPGSMLTLFELMASPDLAVYEEVMESRPFMRCFLIGFIIFGSFGMIALLTGVISESMFEKNQAKVEEDRADRESKRAHFLRACSDLFATMETDEHGAVVLDELIKHKDRIRSLVEAAGTHLTENELCKLLEALDADASGGVDSVEFENGVFQVCQDIRPMSILEVHHCVRRCHLSVSGLECKMEEMGSKIDGLVGVVELALAPESRSGPAPALVRGHSRTRTPSVSLSTGRQRQGQTGQTGQTGHSHSTTPPLLSLPSPPSPRPCTPSARSAATLTGRPSARSRTEEAGAPHSLHSLHSASAAPLASLPSQLSLPLLPSLPASAREMGPGLGFGLGFEGDSATVVAECGEILFSFSQEEGKVEDNEQDKSGDRDRERDRDGHVDMDRHGHMDMDMDRGRDKGNNQDKDKEGDKDENEDRHRQRDDDNDRDNTWDRDRAEAGCRDLAKAGGVGDGDGRGQGQGQGLGQGQSPGPGEDQRQLQAQSQQQRHGRGQWQGQGQAQGHAQGQGQEGQLRKLRQEGGAVVLEDFRRQLQAMARLAEAELELVEHSQQRLSELLEHRAASVPGGGLALLDPQQEGLRSTPAGGA